ncbi:MAG: hypothetical protein FWH01_12625 [Oscillospiraceae bacterium]|nr:hypothetical protein [Oscillospiraceae bacterium]
MSKKPYVVGIAGGTCSGKTTLVKSLVEIFGEYKTVAINMDSYYKKDKPTVIAPVTRIEYVEANHPDSLELDRLYADLEAILDGRGGGGIGENNRGKSGDVSGGNSGKSGVADGGNNGKSGDANIGKSGDDGGGCCDIVFIEGLFALCLDEIREKLDLKVYIDLQSDERLYRRIKRWSDRAGIDGVALRYLDTVRFRHNEFVEPSRWHADMVINGDMSGKGVEILCHYIRNSIC